MELFTFNLIELSLLIAFTILLLVQLIYYFRLYNRIHKQNVAIRKNNIVFTTELPPVSVIITAKNELSNLQRFLPKILEQDYPNYEVIVVNDCVSDESEDILKLMENKYPHLYHTFIPDNSRYLSRKKLAQTIGIKASKYDWLVFTEANCCPAGNEWLKTLARNFTQETGIVLGYSGYEYKTGSLVRLDNLLEAIRYMGYAILKKPYMGIGRNMAYRKEYFFQNKGFSSHLNLQRGEDDLFVNKIATAQNTRVETDSKSIVRVHPFNSNKEWRDKKMSYAITSEQFKGIQRYMLGFETFSRVLFYILFICLIFVSILSLQWILLGISVLIYIARFTCQAIIFNQTAFDLNDGKYIFQLPLFDIIQPINSMRFKLMRIMKKNRFSK